MGLFSHVSLGVEITPTSLRVVGLRMGRKVSFLGCKELSVQSASTESGSKQSQEASSESLAQLLRQALTEAAPHHLPVGRAVVSVPEESVFRKVLELPVLGSDEELAEAIKVEIASYLPQEVSEMEIDYQNLGPLADGNTQQIMVVAVSREYIAKYLEVFRLAKINLAAIDVSAAALARSTVAPSEPKAVALVQVGVSASTVALSQGGVVRVTSSLNQGSGLNEELTEAQEKNLIGNLVDEVDHVLKFHNNRTASHEDVLEVRVVGKGPILKPLQELVRKQVDLPTSLAKPVVSVPAFCDQRFMVALGCALYPTKEAS